MRIRPYLASVCVAAVLAPPAVHAGSLGGTLTSATWTQSIQGVDITVTQNGATCTDTAPRRVSGAGFLTCPTAGLGATGTASASGFFVSLTMPLFQLQRFTTGGTINVGTQAILSGSQHIVGDGSAVTATKGIAGTVVVGGAVHSMGSMWSQPAGGTLVRVPLSVGKPGVYTGTFTVLASPHYVTVDFYGWTSGTRTFTGLTSSGAPLPTVVAMGSLRGSGHVGRLTLVAPSKISIDGPAAQRRTASFASLRLFFAPEPHSALLLGAAGLALLRAARAKRG